MTDEAPLRVVYPSRKNYLGLWALSFLIVPALIAIWRRIQLKLNIYPDRLVIERGKLETDVEEIFLTDIRAIEVKQTLRQRIARIGDLVIVPAEADERERVLPGLPKPKEIQDFIVALRQKQQDQPETED